MTENAPEVFCWECGAEMPGSHDSVCEFAPPSLGAVRARLNAASPGPWTVQYETCDCEYGCSHGRWPYAIHGPKNSAGGVSEEWRERWGHQVSEISELSDADAELIAHARADIEYLLTLIDKAGITE